MTPPDTAHPVAPTVAEIAGALSKASAAVIATLPAPGVHADRVFIGVYRSRSYGSCWRKSARHFNHLERLELAGIVERRVSRGETLWRLTRPLGLSLRAYLQSQEPTHDGE